MNTVKLPELPEALARMITDQSRSYAEGLDLAELCRDYARAAVEASQPKAEAVEGGRKLPGPDDEWCPACGYAVPDLSAQPRAAVTDAKDAALYRSLTRVVLAVQGHRIDWTFGEGSLDAAIEAAALSQGGKP